MTIEFRSTAGQIEPKRSASAVRRDLQGMRAVAVLMVFADHLFSWPRGGFVGVDVFFVLSGFFITGLLIKERTHTGELSFRAFYVRRIRRIIPSAVLVIAITIIASYLLFATARAKETVIDGLWAAIFLSNWRFERVGTDYFGAGQPDSPLLHYWSLSIEEQFYFAWPLLLLGLFAITRRYSRPGNRYPVKRQAWLLGFMAVVCAVSFAWACFVFNLSPTGAYFSTWTRVWELGVGALLAIGAPTLGRLADAARPAMSYAGLAGVLASLFVITPEMAFPGPWAALPVLSTALVIAAFVGARERGVPHLTNPVAQYIGEVSYTLYLWHWPVIILMAAVLPKGLTYYIACIALASALTFLTYTFYENPIRHSKWLNEAAYRGNRAWMNGHPAWAAIGALTAIIVAVAAIGLEIDVNRSTASQDNQTLNVTAAAPDLTAAPPCLGARALTTQGCALYDASEPVFPDRDDFANDGEGAYECYRKTGEPFESCTYGYNGPDGKRLALVGNSHAAMILPALSRYLMENKWSLTTFVGYSCQWMLTTGQDCSDMMDRTQQKLLTEKYDVVLTSASRQHGNSTHVAQYVRAWQPVAAAGSKILVIADVPSTTAETIACVSRIGSNLGTCATPRNVALQKPDELPLAAQQVPGATVLDLNDYFCVGDTCPAVIGNVIVYMDSESHITATYGRTLAPRLIDSIKALVASPAAGR